MGSRATKNEFDTDCAFYAQTSRMNSIHLQAGKDSVTRRLLLGALSSTSAQNEYRTQYSKGSHNELYMLTDRSAAGNALIHDQSRTINTGQSDSDSDYGVEVSNANLMRPGGDNDSDYGVEMTELRKSGGGEAAV